MTNKYIIKNCNVLYFNPDKTAICNDLMLECPIECKERTDCLLKQIVELCKGELGRVRTIGKDILAEEILQKLDIQEVE